MPTYVYACKACDDRTEVIQKMSDDALTTCEKCSGALRRVIFPPAVVYKGSGFYVTDYKNGGAAKAAGSASSGSSETKDESDSKSETKTEAKTETKSDSKPDTGSSTSSSGKSDAAASS